MINTMLNNIEINNKNDVESKLGGSLTTYHVATATAVPLAGIKYEFDINEIVTTDQFQQLLQVLRLAQPEDEVHLHINSPGGCLMTAIQICNAIYSTQAKSVTAHAESQVASAGTMIFLACNQWVVSPMCQFMFHTSTSGAFGKMPDIVKQLEAHKEHLNKVCNTIYKGFLTDKEIDKIVNENYDLYMFSDEVLSRLQNMVSVEEKLIQEEDAKTERMMQKFESLMVEAAATEMEGETVELDENATVEQNVILIPEVDMSMTRDELILTYKELCEDYKNMDENFEPAQIKAGTTKREIINMFEEIADEMITILNKTIDEEAE